MTDSEISINATDVNGLYDHNYSQQLNNSTNISQTKACDDAEWQVYAPKQMKRGNDVRNNNEIGNLNAKKSKSDNTPSGLKLQNRYHALNNTNEMETDYGNSSSKPDIPVREPKVPPIFIPNVQHVKTME